MEVENGIVKWFDARIGKRFGFATTELGTEIFFHFNDGRPVSANAAKRQVEFSNSPVVGMKNGLGYLVDPKVGDEIIFKIAYGHKGEKASPWCFKGMYDQAVEDLVRLPEPQVYRVYQSMGSLGESGTPGNRKNAKVLWEGWNMEEILKKFPLPKSNRSPASDPLFPYFSHDDGFEIHHWWEKKKEDGTWEQCPDPRDVSGLFRQMEEITYNL